MMFQSNRAPSRREALMLGAASAAGLMGGPALGRSPGPEPLLARLSDGPRINAHAHILPASWWAREGDPADAYAAQLQRSMRLARLMIGRQLEAESEAERATYLEAARARTSAWTFEEAASVYLEDLAAAGFDRVFNLTMDNLPVGGGPGAEFTDDFERILRDCAQSRAVFGDRIVHFAGVDPRRGSTAADLLELAVTEYGFAGYGEMIGTLWGVAPDDESLMYPIYERAQALGVPVILDATQGRGFSEPARFARVAADFPVLRICAAGAGAGVAPVAGSTGQPQAAEWAFLELAEQHETIFLDIGDWQAVASGAPPYRRGDGSARRTVEFLSRALSGPAGGRIMFGSDYPIFATLYSEPDWIAALAQASEESDAPLGRADWTRLFSTSPQRFLTADPR